MSYGSWKYGDAPAASSGVDVAKLPLQQQLFADAMTFGGLAETAQDHLVRGFPASSLAGMTFYPTNGGVSDFAASDERFPLGYVRQYTSATLASSRTSGVTNLKLFGSLKHTRRWFFATEFVHVGDVTANFRGAAGLQTPGGLSAAAGIITSLSTTHYVLQANGYLDAPVLATDRALIAPIAVNERKRLYVWYVPGTPNSTLYACIDRGTAGSVEVRASAFYADPVLMAFCENTGAAATKEQRWNWQYIAVDIV